MSLSIPLTTRAIHFNMAQSSKALIAALQRFVDQRLRLSNIYSDYSIKFGGSDGAVRALMKSVTVDTAQGSTQRYLSVNGKVALLGLSSALHGVRTTNSVPQTSATVCRNVQLQPS